MQLHAFVFDETFKTLQGQGSAINLSPWYSQADISIVQVSFVHGNDEVVLVDSSALVRVFSFVTQQFRCASFLSRLLDCSSLSDSWNVDQPQYNCDPSPVPYTRLRMDHASSFFRPRTRDYPSPHIIGRHLAILAEFHWKFRSFHLKGPS